MVRVQVPRQGDKAMKAAIITPQRGDQPMPEDGGVQIIDTDDIFATLRDELGTFDVVPLAHNCLEDCPLGNLKADMWVCDDFRFAKVPIDNTFADALIDSFDATNVGTRRFVVGACIGTVVITGPPDEDGNTTSLAEDTCDWLVRVGQSAAHDWNVEKAMETLANIPGLTIIAIDGNVLDEIFGEGE